ncbi:ferredoxin-thioredoxin reductase catalytic domain-containing protein [Flavobacterium sp. SLB02]|uniref:ferredoxin-thioredoxin reductase catalytic domain-containing protein n=1 Tax=Flavobacterium sp. SLB02 TaxID=2665645 RepID=UPI00351AC8EA
MNLYPFRAYKSLVRKRNSSTLKFFICSCFIVLDKQVSQSLIACDCAVLANKITRSINCNCFIFVLIKDVMLKNLIFYILASAIFLKVLS